MCRFFIRWTPFLENTLDAVHPFSLRSLSLAKGDYRGSRGTRFSSVVAPHRGLNDALEKG